MYQWTKYSMPKVWYSLFNNLADNKGRAVTTLNASLELIKTVFEKI